MASRVALTGGAGFIGGAVARALTARGDEVVAAWATADRARTELGWQAPEIEAGFRDMFPIA